MSAHPFSVFLLKYKKKISNIANGCVLGIRKRTQTIGFLWTRVFASLVDETD